MMDENIKAPVLDDIDYSASAKKGAPKGVSAPILDDMDTPYGIVRTDLLSYLVKDLLCWSNDLGMQLKCTNDFCDIVDSKYYCRTLKFTIDAPNVNPGHRGMNNFYDGF